MQHSSAFSAVSNQVRAACSEDSLAPFVFREEQLESLCPQALQRPSSQRRATGRYLPSLNGENTLWRIPGWWSSYWAEAFEKARNTELYAAWLEALPIPPREEKSLPDFPAVTRPAGLSRCLFFSLLAPAVAGDALWKEI